MEELGRRISRVLRRERERAGLTAAELARRRA
jgi:ribosome-binding protein aMBF1 (putative translation factor)